MRRSLLLAERARSLIRKAFALEMREGPSEGQQAGELAARLEDLLVEMECVQDTIEKKAERAVRRLQKLKSA